MAFEYIGALLEEAVQSTASVEVRGRVEQVVGTIIRAVVPGVKVGELCILRNPWEDWTLRAEVVGFVKQVALLTPLGDLQGISPATEVIPTGEIHSVPVGEDLLGRVLNGLGDPIDGGEAVPATEPHKSIYRKAHRRRAAAQAPDPLSGLRRSPEPHAPQDHRQADFSGPARARRGAYLRRGAAHGYFRGGWRR
mgnify:CR=1 FL=1